MDLEIEGDYVSISSDDPSLFPSSWVKGETTAKLLLQGGELSEPTRMMRALLMQAGVGLPKGYVPLSIPGK